MDSYAGSWMGKMTLAESRDRTKYIVFADYNGLMFPVARVGTMKTARAVAKDEMEQRNAGQALTMRVFRQVEKWRQPKRREE